MDYETAKKLKDVGFVQNPHSISEREEGLGIDSDGKVRNFYPFDAYLPTLSEIIEACGDGFDCLMTGKISGWSAGTYDRYAGDWVHDEEGKTPEEAMANLWISLNNK